MYICVKKKYNRFFIKKVFCLGFRLSHGELKRITWGDLYKQISGSNLDFIKLQSLERIIGVPNDCLQCKRTKFDPWVRRSPEEGNSNPLQYSCLKNPVN